MKFKFLSRSNYKLKTNENFLRKLKKKFKDYYLIPEGGTNALGVLGCQEILNDSDKEFDYICCSVGTGGTICGLINSSNENQKIIGFSSIKVTPQTTRDFIDSESTQSSISFSVGAIFEVQKFQISTFLGIDTMSGEIGRNWIYRNRPWIGIGFGYEIFKPKGKPDNKYP